MKTRLACAARQASVALATIFTLCFAGPVWACPSCTTRSSGGYMIPVLLGLMIMTPYVVSTVVLRIVRKVEAERAQEEAAARAHRDPHASSLSHAGSAGDDAPANA